MSFMDVVEFEIDKMIKDCGRIKDSSTDSLDKSYCDCSIKTLEILKKRIGLE